MKLWKKNALCLALCGAMGLTVLTACGGGGETNSDHASGGSNEITIGVTSFADTLEPELDKLREEASKWVRQEEDVLTYAMFPQVAPKFFEKRNEKAFGVDGDHVDFANKSHPV